MAQRNVEQYLRRVARPERGWIVQLQDAQSGMRFWASILDVDVEAEKMLVVVESDTGADNLGYGAGDAFTVDFRYVHHIGPPASRAQQQAEQRATHPRPTKIPNPSVIDWSELMEDDPPRKRAKQVSEKSRGLD